MAVDAGLAPRRGRCCTSGGSVCDALDIHRAETEIDLFKAELIYHRGPWRGLDDVELVTLEWGDWHNHRRLHSAGHGLTPAGIRTYPLRSTPGTHRGWSLLSLRTHRGDSVHRTPHHVGTRG
jgi:hypothetical protein